MSVIKIELKLDWLEEMIQEGSGISETLKEEVLSTLQAKMLSNAELAIKSKIDEKVAAVAEKVTEEFLTGIMKNQIESMKIPYKSDEWRAEVQYLSLSEYVGMKYKQFLQNKVLDEHGRHTEYSRDAKYTIHEYFVKNALGKDLEKKIANLIVDARQKAEQSVVKTMEMNLQSQLSADIISRLNIPSMLKSLQEKAAEIEMTGGDRT
ncbi:hypothetical protein [Bacillus sp. FJAT-26390]|uniref:hypothetical protein n=1 Tax=Bacillus sp. FJAT-26390 TaxID=1743142 RepID=UPI000807C5E5|nr:hypothetical protein [Bacillus sp. FJAT-26390]OBZ08022.1 hypothetical protein A7975_27215 [Bacillus sp. FJAT-26390]